jgi:eukaryotic-like serine/threonine-protein kinase
LLYSRHIYKITVNQMLVGVTLRNRFKIIQELGSGGFGDTYLAEDIDCKNRPCVVKHLQLKPPNTAAALPIAQRLFKTEAEVLYKLGVHDQIPTLYADFEDNGEFYLVQELIRGHDLTKEIYPGNKLTETAARQLLIDILEVLAFVQQKQIIHRDIKPQNIMRRQDGKIILIDFGAVKEITTLYVTSPGHQPVTIPIGTVGYMPSEQSQGQPKLCSDIYAVGMLILYAITGIPAHDLPKDPTNGEIIWRNWADVSNGFAKILTKMVHYHFSERYQSAE